MNPPARPFVKRRAAATEYGKSSLGPKFTPEGSPSPFSTNAKSMQDALEAQAARPRNQTVSIEWIDGDEPTAQRTSRLQIELAECVETKTVTTTTTTKRSYPPLLIREQPLDKLDAKEYPLALKAIPAGLTNFSFEVEGQLGDIYEDDPSTQIQEVRSQNVSTSPRLFVSCNANTSVCRKCDRALNTICPSRASLAPAKMACGMGRHTKHI